MVWLFLVCQSGKATDATAQKVHSHHLSTVALTEMALPERLGRINFNYRCLWRQ